MFVVLMFIMMFALFYGVGQIPAEKERMFQRDLVSKCVEQKEPTELCKAIIKKYENDKDQTK